MKIQKGEFIGDYKQLRSIIENHFTRYRFYHLIDFEQRSPIVDSSEEMKGFCNRIDQAVSQLSSEEQTLIKERYLNVYEHDYINDTHVFSQVFKPAISPTKYQKLRKSAIRKLALTLGIN